MRSTPTEQEKKSPTEPTGAQADELVRRFSCFEHEDGVYEHAQGAHVAYADYARIQRDREAARGEIADARKPLEAWFDAQDWHSKTLTLPRLIASVLHCVEQSDDLLAGAKSDAYRAIDRANLAESRLESATQPLAPEMERLNKRVIELNAETISLRAQLASAERDAARYRQLRRFVWGQHEGGGQFFVLSIPDPFPNIMRGSVAGHLDTYLDAALSPPSAAEQEGR